MAKRRKRRVDPLLEQAEANASLRYAPEESALQALIGQAHEDLKTDRRVAGALTRTAVRSARSSIPALHQIYNQAARGVKVAQDDVEAAFNQAGVTPDNAFRLVAETEGTAYRQRMAAEAAGARKEAVRQINEARLGRVFAYGAAKDRYNSTVNQLQQRASDLRGERNSFLVSELGRLRDEEAQRQTQVDVATIQQGLDPRTGKPLPGTNAAGAFKPASRSDRKLFSTALARAIDLAPDYATAKISRKDAAEELRAGVARDSKSGDPGFKAIPDQLAVRVALDMAYNQSISPGTRRELLERGFRPNELPGVKYFKNKERRRAERLKSTVGKVDVGIF